MNISTNTPHVTLATRLAVGAVGVAVVSSLAVASSPASAKRADPNGGVATTTVFHLVTGDPGDMLAQRKSLIDPQWWTRLGNVH